MTGPTGSRITTKPTVSHEIGQWCVYPDFKEIKQYTGVLKARNFEIFRESLTEHHLEQYADSFLLASGKLQALCYKADIEAALRTPGFGGFQLLDLHDFPGQGTALVGVLNPFWNEKGYISPAEYSEFCNSTVPLIRLSRMIFKSELKRYRLSSKSHISDLRPGRDQTSMEDHQCKKEVIYKGKLPEMNIPTGQLMKLGEISQPLNNFKNPEMLTITLEAGKFSNHWNIWVYPGKVAGNKTGGACYTKTGLSCPGNTEKRREGFVNPCQRIAEGRKRREHCRRLFKHFLEHGMDSRSGSSYTGHTLQPETSRPE